MKEFKRILATFLVVLMVVTSVPTIGINFKASAAYSDFTITSIVENYISKVGTNRYWNRGYSTNSLISQVDSGDFLSATSSSPCYIPSGYSHISANGCTSNVFTGVSRGLSQCWGFGDYMEYVIFKTTNGSNWNKQYSVSSSFEFHPGDLIRSNKGGTGHTMVIYKVENSRVYIIEANYGGRCKINTRELVDPRSYVNYDSASYVMTPPESLRQSYTEPPTWHIATDMGDDFYAYIIRYSVADGGASDWTHLENISNNVQIAAKNTYYKQSQIWHFKRMSDDYQYKIINDADGTCLDAAGQDNKNGTNIGTFTDNGTAAQRWYIIWNDKANCFNIKSSYCDKVLDANTGGTNVVLYDMNYTQSQSLSIAKIDDYDGTWHVASDMGDDFYAYIIRYKDSSTIADTISGGVSATVNGGTYFENNLNNVQTASKTILCDKRQIWHFQRVSGYQYKIINTYDNTCLDAAGQDNKNGTNIGTFTDNGTAAQRWYIIWNDKANCFNIKSSYCDKVLDANTGGTNVVLYDMNYTQSQKLSILKIQNTDDLHSWNIGAISKVATCTTKGIKTYTCKVCSLIKTEDIASLGHNFASTYIVDTSATCTTAGSKSKHCSRCDAKTEVTVIPATGHKNTYGTKGVGATCTEDGLTPGTVCKDCGTVLNGQEVIKATGHKEMVCSEMVQATCTSDGHTAETRCQKCGLTMTASKVIPATGHKKTVSIPAQNATCTLSGNTAEEICSVCGNVLNELRVVPATGHKDKNNDGKCDVCGTSTGNGSGSENCSCNCHKSGFMGFIWKIINFFNKIFKTNPVCACGKKHY